MADYGIRKYRLKGVLLKRALLDGFSVTDNALCTDSEGSGVHSAFLPGIDSAKPNCAWGRVSMKCQLEPESMITIRAFASDQDSIIRNDEVVKIDDFLLDPDVPKQEKERLFLMAGGLERSGVRDVLLTGQNGRWLWIWLEINGEAIYESRPYAKSSQKGIYYTQKPGAVYAIAESYPWGEIDLPEDTFN